jgi:excisionase family DNA binding protein
MWGEGSAGTQAARPPCIRFKRKGRALDEQLLTVEEASLILEIDRETVERWLARGLPASRGADGELRIRRADLDAFLAQEGQGRSRDAATEY